jgi:hypothetical protein
MNKTQKRIIGWALVAIGVAMVSNKGYAGISG